MTKKKVFSFLAIIMLVLSMVGCSKSSSGEKKDGKITLTLWYWNRSIDDEMIKKVSEEFPNITIKAQKIDGSEYKTKLQTALTSGTGAPDIVGLNDWVTEFLPNHDKFVNLLDYGADKIKDQYLEWKWNFGLTPDQKNLIALPMDTGPTALFYREDFFAEAGLPTDPEEVSKELATWDDYIEAGVKLGAATDAKMFDTINRVYNQTLSQSDKNYFDENDNFIGDSGTVKEAWDRAVTVHQKGLSANLDEWTPEWNAAVNNGEVASFIGAVWMKNILRDAAPDTAGKWRIAKAPGGDGNNGGSFIGILKSSKHPEEAYKVIEWMMNPENQLQSYTTMDLFPSTPSIFEDEKMSSPEEFFGGQETTKVFTESAKNVKPRYFGVDFSRVNSIFSEALTDIARQGDDPVKKWDEVQDQVKKELSR
ncbi:ABC transporter substrate-binding protein [Lederbergia panacisoli]|uniref:ABC transporter substrate-binding protein n=1 Tax=Lederbergia panacisoli TaxID=1255251 RepID=UPI00214C86F2|nr:extracellular solute-binding protein [Lederbergia panacisoli]MCR2823001.1 extracellular solute-binding protein [Lederbergia panacisoli]